MSTREVSAIRPEILVDDSVPTSVSGVLTSKGIRAKHVREVFDREPSKDDIRRYANENKMIVLTQDSKLPYDNKIVFRGNIGEIVSQATFGNSRTGKMTQLNQFPLQVKKPMRAMKVL